MLRGLAVAERAGCFGCHRPPGRGEIPNPGSRWGAVPRFGGGNAFMYAPDRAAIEEFVRFGARRSVLGDPALAAKREAQPVRMPAYEGRLDEGEIADVVAYAAAVEGIDLAPGDEVARGREVARAQGCMGCHGVEGSGGVANPGSLGGFVPGFLGRNFDDLARDEAEFREWVREGTSSRLAANPFVRWWWRRQAVSMPAYGDRLSDEELGLLWTWVQATRAHLDD